MIINPRNDLILIRPFKIEETTKHGIYLPDETRKRSVMVLGKVLAVGPGRFMESGVREAMDVKVGDTVAFSGHCPIFPMKNTPLASIGGGQFPECALISMGNILAVVEPDTDLEFDEEFPEVDDFMDQEPVNALHT
jgi:co-chaperonin GroES (HSP10)